jgi:hypothetical protein
MQRYAALLYAVLYTFNSLISDNIKAVSHCARSYKSRFLKRDGIRRTIGGKKIGDLT